MSNGAMGMVLWVDLTRKQFREEPISEAQYRHCLSGIGLAVQLLYERIPVDADPLGP